MWKTLLRGALALALLSSPVLGQQVWRWSQTPATNATADPAVNWSTGMAPSAVSPSARAMMSAVAKYRDDTAGRMTTAGTSTAYTVTTNSAYATTPADGTRLSLTFHATNGTGATIAADGGTAFPIRVDSSNAVSPAALVANSPYDVVFNSSANAWILIGVFGNPVNVPLGAIMMYTNSAVPNSNFAFPYGQCISRTTYAALFSLFSTTYGGCDGISTFALPDLRGRGVFGVDDMGGSAANRITVAGGNWNGTNYGGSGGLQNHTLTTAEMPIHTPSGNIGALTATGTTNTTNIDHTHTGTTGTESATHTHSVPLGSPPSTSGQFSGLISPNNGWGGTPAAGTTGTESATHTHSFTTDLGGATHAHVFTTNPFTPVFSGNAIGSGTAHTIMPPGISLSFIIRIL